MRWTEGDFFKSAFNLMDLGPSKGAVFFGDLGELGFGAGGMSDGCFFQMFDSEPMAPPWKNMVYVPTWMVDFHGTHVGQNSINDIGCYG